MWTIQLLGGLAARSPDRAATRFRTRKTAALLAYLAFHCRDGAQPCPRELLVELCWPETEPEAGRHNLSNALSALRHVLEPPGVPPGTVLLADRSTVRLNPAAITTDVARFEALAGRCLDARTPSEQRVTLLRAAAGEYGGRLLPGFYEEWATPEAERLAGLFLQLTREVAPLLRTHGEVELLLSCAQRTAADDPWSEEAIRLLMEALAAAGDFSRALRHYREFERRLREELDGQPSPGLQQYAVELRRTRREASSPATDQPAPPLPAETPPLARATGSPFPAPVADEAGVLRGAAFAALTVTRFFGREDETQRLLELLRTPRGRLITLTGPGGTGKTRLALETARRLATAAPDGGAGEEERPTSVTFVPLAELEEGRRVPEVVLRSLGLLPQPGGDPLAQAADALGREAAPLLVLDNFEHLVESAAGYVSALLARVPGARCLVTSRQKLLIEGERELPLAPLPTVAPNETLEELAASPSVQLFLDRAQMSRPDFQLTPRNGAVVAELCAHLEGLPLAVELAAARASLLTPTQILEGIRRDRLDFLVSRRRDAVARHRTLRATLDWSYELLLPEARRFLTQLSVFRGGWTLEAAVAVAGADGEGACVELLAQLRDASLIQLQDREEGIRFTLLETVRQYAMERLEAAGEMERIRRSHADYFVEQAEWEAQLLRTSRHGEAMTRLERENENLRGAVEWAIEVKDHPLRARLGAALMLFWRLEGHSEQTLVWFADVAEEGTAEGDSGFAAQVPSTVLVRLLLGLTSQYGNVGRMDKSEALCRQALALARQIEDPASTADALILWSLQTGSTSLTEKVACLEESVRLARGAGDTALVARTLYYYASFLPGVREMDAAHAALAEALTLYRMLEDPMGIGDVLRGRAALNLERKMDLPGISRDLEENLAIRRQIRDRPGIGLALTELGKLARITGDLAGARERFEEVLAIYQESGWGHSSFRGVVLQELAEVARGQDHPDEAWQLEHRALEIHLRSRYFGRAAECLLSLAELALDQGDLARAARLLGAAERHGPPVALEQDAAQLASSLVARLDPETQGRELAAGACLSDEALLQLVAAGLPAN